MRLQGRGFPPHRQAQQERTAEPVGDRAGPGLSLVVPVATRADCDGRHSRSRHRRVGVLMVHVLRTFGLRTSGAVIVVSALTVAGAVVPSTEAEARPTAPAADAVQADGTRYPVLALDRDFPDPDVLEVDGTYYAHATNSDRTPPVASEP